MSAVGVLTVHHEEHVRRETRVVIAATPGFEVVGEAGSAEEALEQALELRPGLLLVGAHMPGIDGFETSRRLLASLPDARVVLLVDRLERGGASLGESGAIGTAQVSELTPAILRALWEKHRTE
jgi:DNA-binding NarL/FixJ family response regulator